MLQFRDELSKARLSTLNTQPLTLNPPKSLLINLSRKPGDQERTIGRLLFPGFLASCSFLVADLFGGGV
jgi:hypothetical protein